MLLSGKDKGKIGKVTEVVRSKNWVFVEALNTVICSLNVQIATNVFMRSNAVAGCKGLHTLVVSSKPCQNAQTSQLVSMHNANRSDSSY